MASVSACGTLRLRGISGRSAVAFTTQIQSSRIWKPTTRTCGRSATLSWAEWRIRTRCMSSAMRLSHRTRSGRSHVIKGNQRWPRPEEKNRLSLKRQHERWARKETMLEPCLGVALSWISRICWWCGCILRWQRPEPGMHGYLIHFICKSPYWIRPTQRLLLVSSSGKVGLRAAGKGEADTKWLCLAR